MLIQRLPQPHEVAGTLLRRRGSPARVGSLRRSDGGIYVGGAAQRDTADDFAGRGVADLLHLTGFRVDPPAAYVVTDHLSRCACLCHDRPPGLGSSVAAFARAAWLW